MSDPTHPTVAATELYDAELFPAPKGATLLVINEGGSLLKGPYYPGCLAWGFLPKIPSSVKKRQEEKMTQKQKQESESISDPFIQIKQACQQRKEGGGHRPRLPEGVGE